MASNFALGSPRANEPYPVESQIISSMMANMKGNDASRLGSMLLGNYWQERGNQEYDYNKQVQAQNAYAQAQLAAEMENNARKNAIDLFGKTGGPQIIAGSPSQQYALAGDVAQNVYSDVAGNLRAGELAKTLQAAQAASKSGADAGTPIPAGTINALVPGANATQATPLSLQEIAAREQAATNRAAADNSGATVKLITNSPVFGTPVAEVTFKKVPANAEALGRVLGLRGTIENPGGTYQRAPQSSTTPPSPGSGPGMGGQGGGGTMTTQSGSPLDVRTPAGVAQQAQARNVLNQLKLKGTPEARAAAADIEAGMRGTGVIQMRQGPKGMIIQGAKNTYE